MRRINKAGAALATVLALSAGAVPVARPQAIGQGFEYERAGKAAEAARIYLSTLRVEAANPAALLGLERVLPHLDRLAELLPLVQRARALDPANSIIRGLELRTYAGLNEMDSVDAVARRWAADAPRDDAPYREWLIALGDARQFEAARGVIAQARSTISRPGALAIEAAELEQRLGNWEGAAREWGAAVATNPAILPNATSQLEDAPDASRDGIVRTLSVPGSGLAARRMAAELLLGWGEPLQGWGLLESTLTPPTAEAIGALRRFADLANGSGPETHRARGSALARLAEFAPAPLASRIRADAVRALVDGGDRAAARIVLERIATDSAAVPEAQALAQAALVEILVEEGTLDLAAARLAELGDRVSADDRLALRRALARARVRRGELDLADSALRGDSSVATIALRGWVALYRGEITRAVELFRAAGPYAGDRSDATERTAMLALLQGFREPRVPELGSALLLLAEGDSSGAVAALRRVAERAGGGRAGVLLLAGQVAARLGGPQDATAAELFAEVVRTGGSGAAAPAAELEWARLLVRQDRTAEAVAHLEHLILTYPESAFVPEARRELERAKGAIPRS